MQKIGKRILQRLRHELDYGLETIKYWAIYPFASKMYCGHEIYLVSERGTDARDNGFYMYRYIRTQHPEIEAYYIIDKTSADYEKVKSYGNVVQYKSLKHYVLFIASCYKISTHIMGYSPNTPFYSFYNLKHRIPGKQIFLQHGVIKDDLVGLYEENCLVDVFICGAKPEYEYVNRVFHYKNNEVKYTGLARYDGLSNSTIKRQILLMPTWRMYLKTLHPEEISQSKYVQCWNAVLNDVRVQETLKQHNIVLVFYPHYEMQPYLHFFNSCCDCVKIADFAHYDVQQLLKESMLLITDYSSVFFDFAYMRKPIIYYQFDEAEFYNRHYKKGYFDYRENGFGPVCTAHEALVHALIDELNSECVMNAVYKRRAIDFFPLHDCENCKRIFEEIRKLK